MKKTLLFLIAFAFFFNQSCKDAQWVLKQKDKNVKYAYLQKFYNKGNHVDAVPIIEDLMSQYKGTDTAERLYFMLAESYFYSKEYMISAYHFKNFVELYPRSYKAEVASFKIAECYKSEIPRLELQQGDTEKAIEYYTKFLTDYPKSAMVELAEEHLNQLKRIIERKALDAANLYYKTGNYRAAAVTYKNVLTQYPSIGEYEDLSYKVSMSYYKFAEKSILTKQADRFETALDEGNLFINRFPTSKYVNEVKTMVSNCKVQILETALKNAMNYFIVSERPLYFHQALGLYSDFGPEIKLKPTSIQNYEDKCYLGILKSYYLQLEDAQGKDSKAASYQSFVTNYYQIITKFKSKSLELIQAEELFKKAEQIKS